MVRMLGINDKVIFTGFRSDMPRVYAAMDLFVLASEAEACGRVVLEAMALAKPVIGTFTGGTPEAVQDGITGLLFTPGDYRDLAGKIMRLSNDLESAKKFGLAGRKLVEEKFTIQANVSAIEAEYRQLLGIKP
jgi:glycosyltransferase involved in cell wall biosynthesis